ncbi:MAG TPA: hypothetical protein PKY56_08820 [Candidatus Kapabacteria bacterium]|nr:hypothetical protein [Candidatus Kapabacteria bacterium]HPO63388.1 hypothetical protein [Candidatus Kapabacteria bacterium]
MLYLIISLLFGINLQTVEYSEINNSVIVISDNLVCKDCLATVAALDTLWSAKYKTILVSSAMFNKESVCFIKNLFEDRIEFDEIYFDKKVKKMGFSVIKINDYTFDKTPALIIKINNKEKIIKFEEMFSGNNYKEKVKQLIEKSIKELEKK